MDVLSDFKIRLNTFVPENEIENEIASLHNIIIEKDDKIKNWKPLFWHCKKGGKGKKQGSKNNKYFLS